MTDMNVIRAAKEDSAGITSLLKEVDSPSEGILEHLDNFLVLKGEGKLIGCAGLEITRTSCLLRSLAVRRSEQGKGYGDILVGRVLEMIKKAKKERVYLLTTDKEDYFKRFDFRVIDRKEADPEIQKTPQFTYICCQSAVCMVKTIE